MLRNLDWLHHLNIEYDSSTFDTDPFEPMPDGTGTIFPFFVPRTGKSSIADQEPIKAAPVAAVADRGTTVAPAADRGTPVAAVADRGTHQPNQQSSSADPIRDQRSAISDPAKPRGYVELPYTLPQDSTVFLLFQEPHVNTWKNKLAWLARQNGTALLNVHPDYISFDSANQSSNQYPARLYKKFLLHVKSEYASNRWDALPHELAAEYLAYRKSAQQAAPALETLAAESDLSGRRALVFLFSFYPSDPRPKRAAEAMAASGMGVDLICLKESEDEPFRENIAGVYVRRISLKKRREGKIAYLWQYSAFFLACFAFATV